MRELFSLFRLAAENRRHRKKVDRLERETLGKYSWYRSLKRAYSRVYRWRSAFTVSRLGRGKAGVPRDDLIYGETPALTAYELLSMVGVDQADHVVELGGGSSMFSLVAVSAFGCRATVLEILPGFVAKTREIVSVLGLERLKVRLQNILEGRLPEGTLYYLTGTTFSDESWKVLQRQMAVAPVGAKAISLSVPLDSKAWKVESEHMLAFSWGENSVYLQTRI